MGNFLKQNYVIFCDFDGTITKEDTTNKLFELFAEKEWIEIEKMWQDGLIGSKECIEKQVECIKNISQIELENFIKKIEIDESFIGLMSFININQIEFYIVSDGFDLVIKKVLERYGITGAKIFSNGLEYKDNSLIPSFNFNSIDCEKKAGLCKCKVIQENRNNKKIVYIGDGLSDICAAKFADILFAKGKLMHYAETRKLSYIPFSNFGEIWSVLHKRGDINNDRLEHSNR